MSENANIGRRIGSRKWSEHTIDEKVEILKEEIFYLRNLISRLDGLLDKLQRHSHQDGQIVVPMANRTEYGSEYRIDPLV